MYKKSIFKNTIAHGMMIGGILSEMLFAEYGDLWLSKSSIDIKFKAPVYMNEEITTYGKVIKNEDNKSLCRLLKNSAYGLKPTHKYFSQFNQTQFDKLPLELLQKIYKKQYTSVPKSKSKSY